MKLSYNIFALSFLFGAPTGISSALLDCSAVSRISGGSALGDEQAVCDHFAGVESQGYNDWYESNDISSKYPNLVYLPGSDPTKPENGAAVHWRVDGEYVYLAIAARATGWLGFGIGDAGGMIGADMVLFTAARPNELIDAYTTDIRFPQTDDCPSDWEPISSHVDSEGGFLMFETKRLLDTGDPQDKVIVNDASPLIPAHRVIAAWGDSAEVGYHGLNRTRGAIRFFGSGDERATFEAAMDSFAEGYFEVRSKDHLIPAEETEYAQACFSRQDLIDQGVLDTQDMLNIIGFEPILSEDTKAYVHHYIVSGGSSCDQDGLNEMVYVWAPGDGALALPDNLGAPLFGDDGYEAFGIETHYNNPQLNEGVIDNSGVRLYWTSQSRDEQIGILALGDPQVNLYGAPVGNGLTLHEFECPGSCSSLVDKPVTVLREYLHMHQTGMRITNEQIRDGEVIRMGTIEYWEFDQNGNAAALQDPFDIQPGDGFKTSCYYNGDDSTKFGLSSQDEMCIAFLYYHPRVKVKFESFEMPWICALDLGVEACETGYVKTILSSEEDLNRTFGIEADECSMGESDEDSSEEGGAESSGTTIHQLGIFVLALGTGFLFF